MSYSTYYQYYTPYLVGDNSNISLSCQINVINMPKEVLFNYHLGASHLVGAVLIINFYFFIFHLASAIGLGVAPSSFLGGTGVAP
ncbi:MAG: hypothetical protein IKX65_00595 [Prevotella sp.]|nr:hypothetical protein [Prevotella sp.]